MQERKSEQAIIITRNKNGLVFEGTRILIHQIIGRANVVQDIEEARKEFVEDYPWLSPEHFDVAQAYYQNHKEEIDKEINKEKLIRALMAKHSVPKKGVDIDALESDPEYQSLNSSN